MLFFYQIFGLHLQSDRLLPRLESVCSVPHVDVELYVGALPPALEALRQTSQSCGYESSHLFMGQTPALQVQTLGNGAYRRLCFYDGAEFIIDRSGNALWAIWLASTTLEQVVDHLLYSLVGFILGRRGVSCLHAAAVAYGGEAMALLGASSSGKSTLTAALGSRGCAVLSDDMIALDAATGTFRVPTGYPWISLRPDAIAFLEGMTAIQPFIGPIWTYLGENYVTFDIQQAGFCMPRYPLPLRVLYLLEPQSSEDQAIRIEAVTAYEGLIPLLARAAATHMYDSELLAREFDVVSHLAAQVMIRRVSFRWVPSDLPPLCDALLQDFQSVVGSSSVRQGSAQI